MGKGSAVLGIIALLLAAGGFGISVINWIEIGTPEIPEKDFWYSYREDVYTPTLLQYLTVPDLYVIVDVPVNTTVHVLFTTSTRILPNPASFADMLFYFWLDGTRLLNPYTRAGPYEGDATYQYYPVALQHLLILTPGIHNISVVVISEEAGNFMRESALAVSKVTI